MSMSTTANYRCDTHSHMHPVTQIYAHTLLPTPLSRNRFLQAAVIQVKQTTTSPSLLSLSLLGQEGTCQRMLSSPASQSSQGQRRTENKWTLKANKDSEWRMCKPKPLMKTVLIKLTSSFTSTHLSIKLNIDIESLALGLIMCH